MKYFSYTIENEEKIRSSYATMITLSAEEARILLASAEKRRDDKLTTGVAIEEKAENRPVYFSRTDITKMGFAHNPTLRGSESRFAYIGYANAPRVRAAIVTY